MTEREAPAPPTEDPAVAQEAEALAPVLQQHLGVDKDAAVVVALGIVLAARARAPDTAARRRARKILRAAQQYFETSAGSDHREMAMRLRLEADRLAPRGRGRPRGGETPSLWPELAYLWRRTRGPIPHSRGGGFIGFVAAVHEALGMAAPSGETLRDAAPNLAAAADQRLTMTQELEMLQGVYGTR